MSLLEWLDNRLHMLKCRVWKRGWMRTFRLIRRLTLPLCDRVSLEEHCR